MVPCYPSRMLYLECQNPRHGSSYPLRSGANVLGRSPDASVHITDPSLSRRHAELRVVSGAVVVRDLGSHNGTRVNGARISGETQLLPGASLQCGDVVLTLCEVAEQAPPTPAFIPPSAVGAIDPSKTVALKAVREGETDPVARRLSTLLRVGELLASPGLLEDIQGRILDLAAEILPIDRAVLLTVDDAGAIHVAAHRIPGGTTERPYSESIVRYVVEHRVAAQFDDAQADQRLQSAASLVAQSIRCAMCAPLIVDDRILGVIYVDNRLTTHIFDPADLELLAGFANQAAVAMNNAALQARLKQAAVRQNTFERFFPPATAAKLLESGGDLGVQELFVTALFSDISAYTAMSSTMSPAQVVELLHQYFPPMAKIVFDKGGTLEKYIGDALLAVWGAPFSFEDDADRAVEAAVEMHRAVEQMRASLPKPIDIHIGMHSGVVALANIGSAEYLQVATIGDATNTSARVCSVAGDGELVISQQTADRLTRPRFPLTALPPTRVKGKSEPLQLYRVDWRRG